MTAAPTGRDRPGDRTGGPPTTAAGPAPAGRGAGPRPGVDCHALSCSFPLCEWPWCDEDLLNTPLEEDSTEEWDREDFWEEGEEICCCGQPLHDDEDCCCTRPSARRVELRSTLLSVEGPDRNAHDTRDNGSATVEAAVALSAMVVVLVLGIAAVLAVITQIRLVDAAGAAARLAARGDTDAAQTAVDRLAPDGVRLSISRAGAWTTVSISAPAVPLLPGVRLSARAVAATEGQSGGP